MTSTRTRTAVVGTLAMALWLWAAPNLARAWAPPAGSRPVAGSSARGGGGGSRAWAISALVFVVISAGGGYVWYAGLFPWLLRGPNPRWPLEAWRLSTCAFWLTVCLAALAFQGPTKPHLDRLFSGSNNFQSMMKQWSFFVLLAVACLLGCLVTWNFRRGTARPTD